MLVRTDPFRELDRVASQVFGTVARPAAMPMDAWRDGDTLSSSSTYPPSIPSGWSSTSSAMCSPSAPNGSPPPVPTSS